MTTDGHLAQQHHRHRGRVDAGVAREEDRKVNMSWTKLGAILIGAAMFLKATAGIIPMAPEIATVLEALAAMMGAIGVPVGGIGLRNAIGKNGQGR